MPTILTLVTLFISFLVTVLITPYWIRRARHGGIVGKDMNKPDHRLVPELGGICVIGGFLIGVLIWIASRIFVYQVNHNISLVLATVTSILIATIIGLVDDILGWKIGLRVRYKVALTFFIGLPIVVLNAGQSAMNIPLLGQVELGLIYPLLLIPLGIMGTANGFNMIAGYNGLEAGMGIIMLSTLGGLAYSVNEGYVSVIAFCMVAALCAFFLFNKYPAHIFPGNTMTHSVGALVAIIAILANIEKYAVVLFAPYFLELLLKARGRMKKESFAKPLKDGILVNRYPRWYGIEHIVISLLRKIKKQAYEKDVVWTLLFGEIILAGITVGYFYLTNKGIV